MPTSYNDQSSPVDIFNVSDGDTMTVVSITLNDLDDDGLIDPGDTINGFTIANVYVGDRVTVDGVEITGVTFTTDGGGPFFTPNDGSVLAPGTDDSTTTVTASTSMPVSTLGPPCFVRVTMILTPYGRVPVEALEVGDLVTTRENGAQPLTWVGGARTRGRAQFAPVRFNIGAIGNDEVLEVSQQHRMLVNSALVELNFGRSDVLVAAKHLVGRAGISIVPRDTVDYVHIMCDDHEVVCANGIWSESFYYSVQELSGLDDALRQEREDIFADDVAVAARFSQTSHYCLRAYEAVLLAL